MILERRRAYNESRIWSKNEENTLLRYLKNNDFHLKEIQKLFPNRTSQSIRSKVRRMRINEDLFGELYRDEKILFSKKIAGRIKPKYVFDAYAGAGHQTFVWAGKAKIVYSSERKTKKINQFIKNALHKNYNRTISDMKHWDLFTKNGSKIYLFHGDAIKAAAEIVTNERLIDLIDLDTCGTTLPTIPLFLALLKPKHLIITHGEFHSMRFQREDVLRRLFCHRDVYSSPFPITVDEMTKELDKAVKLSALRSHNETNDSFWLELKNESWLGNKFTGILRRHYKICKPPSTADCLNMLDPSITRRI